MRNRMNHATQSVSFSKMVSTKRAITVADGPLLIS
jgi:hypothetical protein